MLAAMQDRRRPSAATRLVRAVFRAGTLAALVVLAALAATAAPAAQAAGCARISIGDAPVNVGTTDEVQCFEFAVLDRPERVKATIAVIDRYIQSYEIVNAAGKRECAKTTGVPVLCELDAAGTYRVNVPGGAVSVATIAIQDVIRPRGCRDLGRSPNVTVSVDAAPDLPTCFSFRVNSRGLHLRGNWEGLYFGLPLVWLSDGARLRCSSSKQPYAFSRHLLELCGLEEGSYSLTVRPSDPHFGRWVSLAPPAPNSCSSAGRTTLSWGRWSGDPVAFTGFEDGTFNGPNIDCATVPAYAGDQLWVSVTTPGRQGAGRRIRRPDGTVLCSTTSLAPVPCIADVTGDHTVETWHRPTLAAGERRAYTIGVLRTETTARFDWDCERLTAPGAWTGRRVRTSEPPRCFELTVREEGQWLQRAAGDPDIVIYDRSGREICRLKGEDCTLPVAGNYRVYVTGRFGHWGFTVHRWTTPRPAGCSSEQAMPISYRDTPRTQTWVGTEHDCLRFFGVAGQMVSASIAWTGDGRPAKRIVAEDGSEVCRSGAWSPLLCRIPATGRYYLESWRLPPPEGSVTTTYRVSLRDYQISIWSGTGFGATAGCEKAWIYDPGAPKTVSGRRDRVTDHPTCYLLDRYFADGHRFRSWKLRLAPGATRMRVYDGAGRPICRDIAKKPCTYSGPGYLMVTGSAGDYAFTLSRP